MGEGTKGQSLTAQTRSLYLTGRERNKGNNQEVSGYAAKVLLPSLR
jgi:hypothetical protein